MTPSPRTIQRALGVLERLPEEALFDLVERLVDRLDEADPDPDLEEEHDACDAEDVVDTHRFMLGVGDADDAEFNGDDEPDDEDMDAVRQGCAEPAHPWMRHRPRGSTGTWEPVR